MLHPPSAIDPPSQPKWYLLHYSLSMATMDPPGAEGSRLGRVASFDYDERAGFLQELSEKLGTETVPASFWACL